MESWIDPIWKESRKIRQAAYELGDLAYTFHLVGNDHIAEKIGLISEELLEAEEAIKSVISNKIHEDFKQTGQSTANMMNTIFAVLKSGEE